MPALGEQRLQIGKALGVRVVGAVEDGHPQAPGSRLQVQGVGHEAAHHDDRRGRERVAAQGGIERHPGALRKVGLVNPEVVVTPVDSLVRGVTGKLKRFVPMDSAAPIG